MTAGQLEAAERAKYEKVWALPEYSRFSPGETMLPLFRQMVRPRHARTTLLDIGCGCGRAGALLEAEGWSVTQIDLVDAREDHSLQFDLINIWDWPGDVAWEDFAVGYCCDVMEHIPPEKVDAALHNILKACRRVFFSICFTEDHFGKVVGEPLHLTVKPFTWWLEKLREHGKVKNARDLLGEGVFDVVR